MIPLPPGEAGASYVQLSALLLKRRSVLNFQHRPVPAELLEQVLAAVSTAPMGIPPSDVEVLVLENKAAVQRFTADVIAYLQKTRWLFSDLTLRLTHPFMSAENASMYRDFLAVAIRGILEKHAHGEDWLTYDAPYALYFYTSPFADPADPIIAATYAMLAAESLGLGSCMLGMIPYCFQYSRSLREKYEVPHKSQGGLMQVLGFPSVTYCRGIKRRLGDVRVVA